MPTPTYTLIQEQVLGSAQAAVTFSSIPQTYKDLVFEFVNTHTTGSQTTFVRFNGDSANNYSYTYLSGIGTSAISGRGNTYNGSVVGGSYPTIGMAIVNIMSYTNTNIFKTVIVRDSYSSAEAGLWVSPWRSTAAITSLELSSVGSTFIAGSIFRLWGVVG